MKMHKAAYQGGQSRTRPGEAVDYMQVVVEVDGEDVELHAEMINPTWDDGTETFADESATYDDLKAAILDQAAEHGVPADALRFYYDK